MAGPDELDKHAVQILRDPASLSRESDEILQRVQG